MGGDRRQGETEGGGLRERWMKAADGGYNGSQGLKRMDMWPMRCWAAAAAQYLIFDLIRTWDGKRKIGWRKKCFD